MKTSYICGLFVLLGGLGACNKFVATPVPVNSITPQAVFASDGSATATLLGAYSSVLNTEASVYEEAALFSDELIYGTASGPTEEAMDNTYDNTVDYGFFSNYYRTIYECNAILEGLKTTSALSDSVASMLKGESEFLRAFGHLRLMAFYGNIPLITTTDVTKTALEPNTPVAQILDTVIADLKDAYAILPASYPTADRVRANKWAAGALLAAAYLYKGDWTDAETVAGAVIASGVYSLPTDLNTVFLKSSSETIWQLWEQNGVTGVGSTWLPTSSSSIYYYVRPGVVSAFEPGDLRMTAWLRQGTGGSAGLYYPYKYKQRLANTGSNMEDLVVLRLAEQYLNRAEARAHEGDLSGGLSDLNVIRQRAGLPVSTVSTTDSLLLAVEQERRIEFLCEDGQRWFDLNRTGRASYWLAPVKPGWQARDTLLPYPQSILLANPSLQQNAGY